MELLEAVRRPAARLHTPMAHGVGCRPGQGLVSPVRGILAAKSVRQRRVTRGAAQTHGINRLCGSATFELISGDGGERREAPALEHFPAWLVRPEKIALLSNRQGLLDPKVPAVSTPPRSRPCAGPRFPGCIDRRNHGAIPFLEFGLLDAGGAEMQESFPKASSRDNWLKRLSLARGSAKPWFSLGKYLYPHS